MPRIGSIGLEFPEDEPGREWDAMLIQELADKKLASPPPWLPANTMYLTIMGSLAYGVSSDASDYDLVGFAIPRKEEVFPHLAGEVWGFGRQKQRFDQWQQHHVHDPSACSGHGRTYDLTVFGIVKLFNLAMDCNPNVIDALFTPRECVIHTTRVGEMVREDRRLFLHKGAWHRFKGYAYAQLNKLNHKEPEGKRAAIVAQHGYDTKFAYHVIRLIAEVEQIMLEGDLDLQRNREELKAIRRGEWTEARLREVFAERERGLEDVYKRSTIPHSPDEAAIKGLLLRCLEEHYGSLDRAVVTEDRATATLREVRDLIERSGVV